MTNRFWTVFDYALILFETVIFLLYIDKHHKRRELSTDSRVDTFFRFFLCVVLFMSHLLLRKSSSDSEGLMLISAITDLLFSIFLYKENVSRLVVNVLSFYVLLILLDLSAFLCWPVPDMDYDDFLIIAAVITRLSLPPILLLGQRATRRISRYISCLMCIPIIAASVTLVIIVFVVNEENLQSIRSLGIFLLISAVVLNICTLALGIHTQRSQEEKERLTVLEAHRRAQEIYFQSLKEAALTASSAAHDSRHHMGIILEYLETGDYKRAREYIISTDAGIAKKLTFTGNQTVDTILNSQVKRYEEDDIQLCVMGVLPSELPFDEVDLCIILANALENAREECLRLPAGKSRTVTISFRCEGWLQITVRNQYLGLLEKSIGGKFLSKKRDCLSSGIGLDSIEKACIRQNGFMVVRTNNNVFTLSATLQPDNYLPNY